MSKRVFPAVFFVLLALFWAKTARGWHPAEGLPAPVPVWDPSARATVTRFEALDHRLDSLVLSGDGSRLIVCGFQTDQMWDVGRQRVLHTFGAVDESGSLVAFTSRASQLLMGSVVVDLAPTRVVHLLPLTQYAVHYATAVNARGTRLLGYQDHVLKLWDLRTGRPLQSFGRVAESSSAKMALSADGSRVAVADEQGQVQVWNAGSGVRVQSFPSEMDVLNTLAFSPDGSKLLLGGLVTPFWPIDAVTVKVWDLEHKAWTGQFKAPLGETLKVAMSADGSSILAAQRSSLSLGFWRMLKGEFPTHERYRILMWNTRTAARTTLVEQVQYIRSATPVAFSADGSSVAIELQDGVWVFKP